MRNAYSRVAGALLIQVRRAQVRLACIVLPFVGSARKLVREMQSLRRVCDQPSDERLDSKAGLKTTAPLRARASNPRRWCDGWFGSRSFLAL
jgi:hypothetical protein